MRESNPPVRLTEALAAECVSLVLSLADAATEGGARCAELHLGPPAVKQITDLRDKIMEAGDA